MSVPATAATTAAAPGAVGSLTVTPGRKRLDVSWTAPADNGSPITWYSVLAAHEATSSDGMGYGYIVDLDAPVGVAEGGTVTQSFTRLNNGTDYKVYVTAYNAVGDGPVTISDPVAPRGVPDPPTTVVTTRGDRTVGVSWSAPRDTGGSPLTGYTVTLTPPGGAPRSLTVGPTATSAAFGSLSNSTGYALSVVATNELGDSTASTSAAAPGTAPGAVTGVSATRGDRRATVRWSPPSDAGNLPLTGYTVTASPGGATRTVAADARSLAFTGLRNGTRYTFAVAARNAVGLGSPVATRTAVVPAGAPARPARPVVVAGRRSATVSWRPSAANGSPVVRYQVRSSTGIVRTVSGRSRSTRFTGFRKGSRISFRVRAVTSAGTGAYSLASRLVKVA